MKAHEPLYDDISFLLVYFNANAYDPERLTEDLASMPVVDQEQAKQDLMFLLKEDRLGSSEFYAATSCSARNEVAARAFFEDVFKYAFEGGEEPSISEYRNR
ncbi:hypothetical protein [uncultured Litoreibacter sp.]|uniref:hypothetical protein n=1 Tax=uncultured Litoreibacter sp. TaxID=1392394 RepID=UPI00262A3F3A|nr:hypothetical protein [uncultured Litoreibacter sp.]